MGAVTERLVDTIKGFENPNKLGFSGNTVKSYWDSNGYAIGWGNRFLSSGATVKKDTIISVGEAEQLILDTCNQFAGIVNGAITANISQNQFEALVSLTYNIGPAFSSSTLAKVINANPNDKDSVSREFRRWIYVTENGVKKQSDVLKARRERELALYLGGAVAAASGLFIVVVIIGLYILKKKRII